MRAGPRVLASVLMILSCAGGSFAWPEGSRDARSGRIPLLEAARQVRLVSPGGSLAGAAPGGDSGGVESGWLGRFVRKHRYHVLGVFLAEEVEYLYTSRIGPPDDPLVFDSVPSWDRAFHGRFGGGTESGGFLVRNKTRVVQALALGAMVAANERDLEGYEDDIMGLVEAHKFNWAATSLVKSIVGRRRPSREEDLAGDGFNVRPLADGETRGRDSFYSDTASRVFTYAAYTDSILARRFGGRSWVRGLGAAGLYGVAGYVSWSRLRAGRHYLTDVVAGAGAGFLTGRIFYRLNHPDEKRGEAADVALEPVIVPGGAGLGVSVRF